MKIRTGFVSNSSSASFVVDKDNLTAFQIFAIKNHIEFGELLNEFAGCGRYGGDNPAFYVNPSDRWEICETNHTINGSTSMTNFDMHYFMKLLGIDMDLVRYMED